MVNTEGLVPETQTAIDTVYVFDVYFRGTYKQIFVESVIAELCGYTAEVKLVFISQRLQKGIKVKGFCF
jgi:hypothetical protein